MNAPFPNKLVFFLTTTLIQLWISIIVLFYNYLYPDLRFFKFVLIFITGGMCGLTSFNTLYIILFDLP